MAGILGLQATVIWGQLTAYARSSLLKALRNSSIDQGQLVITEGLEEYCFGRDSELQSYTRATVHVKSENFWLKMFLRNDLGFAEAYMDGDFETSVLKSVLYLWTDNSQLMESLSTLPYKIFSALSAIYIRFLGQTLSKAVENVVTGYDCSNDFFEMLLGEDLTYSCTLWTDQLGGVTGDQDGVDNDNSLGDAQLNKLHNILRMARIERGYRLLEFGSGWGSLAIEAAKQGCMVDTITLSIEQKRGAEKRIRDAGLQESIIVHQLDYRKLPPEFDGVFDAFAVGISNLPLYFKIVDRALKPDKGVVVIQLTTQPESHHKIYQSRDYVRTYQWPNSFLPSATLFLSTAASAINGRLCLESAVNYGAHYPRTLRTWGRRLQSNWDDELVAKLRLKHPELASDEAMAIFKRKWEYMCIYAEVGFARGYTSLHLVTLARPALNVKRHCD